jgi:hypothetical protein
LKLGLKIQCQGGTDRGYERRTYYKMKGTLERIG